MYRIAALLLLHILGFRADAAPDCQLSTKGYGPLPDEDTPEAFREFKVLQDSAINAVASSGYTLAVQNENGAITPGPGYLGL